MNTFDTAYKTDNAPIRLSYHANVHYNSIVDPYAASIGVGLGLPGFQPGVRHCFFEDFYHHISHSLSYSLNDLVFTLILPKI